MPCTDIEPMRDALEKRIVIKRRAIAQVDGANQAGCTLRIRGLDEKLWVSDLLYIGMCGFTVRATYEPFDGKSQEISVHPCFIISGQYKNIDGSPPNGALIRRWPTKKVVCGLS